MILRGCGGTDSRVVGEGQSFRYGKRSDLRVGFVLMMILDVALG